MFTSFIVKKQARLGENNLTHWDCVYPEHVTAPTNQQGQDTQPTGKQAHPQKIS